MNKLLLSAAVAALAVSPLLSQSAHAQDTSSTSSSSQPSTNPLDNFYVAGNLGQTQFRDGGVTHNNSVFQNVRFGWRWNGYVGPEIGYVYLGRPSDTVGTTQYSVQPRAATVGVNGKYNFYQNWFVTAHAGYMRSRSNLRTTSGDDSFTNKTWNNGVYAGAGVGYDITNNFSLALNYDNYRVQYGNGTDSDHGRTNVAAYSASVEYRF